MEAAGVRLAEYSSVRYLVRSGYCIRGTHSTWLVAPTWNRKESRKPLLRKPSPGKWKAGSRPESRTRQKWKAGEPENLHAGGNLHASPALIFPNSLFSYIAFRSNFPCS